jgi:hypothetical protein
MWIVVQDVAAARKLLTEGHRRVPCRNYHDDIQLAGELINNLCPLIY